MYIQSLGLEAVRANLKIQNLWQKHHEIYLEVGHFRSGKAATYLIFHTNTHIRRLILDFIYKYHHSQKQNDLRETLCFQQDYEIFLKTLNHEVNFYARSNQHEYCKHAYEDTISIFEKSDPLNSIC